MFVDHQGFNNFKIVRTSDVKYYDYEAIDGRRYVLDEEQSNYSNYSLNSLSRTRSGTTIQSLKITVFTFYNEMIGRIQAQEYLIQQHRYADEYEFGLDGDNSQQEFTSLNFEKMYEDMYTI